jgi:hypothetical protein
MAFEDILIFLVIHLYAWLSEWLHYLNHDDTCQAFLFHLISCDGINPCGGRMLLV